MDIVAEFQRLLDGYRNDWTTAAACRDVDDSLFFPTRDTTVDKAMAVCEICPVRYECLEYALETRQEYGVWGGKTAQERLKIRRGRNRSRLKEIHDLSD